MKKIFRLTTNTIHDCLKDTNDNIFTNQTNLAREILQTHQESLDNWSPTILRAHIQDIILSILKKERCFIHFVGTCFCLFIAFDKEWNPQSNFAKLQLSQYYNINYHYWYIGWTLVGAHLQVMCLVQNTIGMALRSGLHHGPWSRTMEDGCFPWSDLMVQLQ